MNEMQSFNAERNFITNAKQKWKNASKIVSHVLKKHHAQNGSNDSVDTGYKYSHIFILFQNIRAFCI
jgi:hypothetical protein